MINTIVLAACQLVLFTPDQGMHVCKYTCDQGPKTTITIVSNRSTFVCQTHMQVPRWMHNKTQ